MRNKSKPKKKYPSQIKRDKTHPTVSARLPMEIRNKLHLNLEKLGISMADAFKVLAGELELQVKPIEEARKAGFKEARQHYKVTYPCYICGKRRVITSSEEKEAAGKYMKDHGWHCSECHNKTQQS